MAALTTATVQLQFQLTFTEPNKVIRVKQNKVMLKDIKKEKIEISTISSNWYTIRGSNPGHLIKS